MSEAAKLLLKGSPVSAAGVGGALVDTAVMLVLDACLLGDAKRESVLRKLDLRFGRVRRTEASKGRGGSFTLGLLSRSL